MIIFIGGGDWFKCEFPCSKYVNIDQFREESYLYKKSSKIIVVCFNEEAKIDFQLSNENQELISTEKIEDIILYPKDEETLEKLYKFVHVDEFFFVTGPNAEDLVLKFVQESFFNRINGPNLHARECYKIFKKKAHIKQTNYSDDEDPLS